MSKLSDKVQELREKGLVVGNDNKHVEAKTYEAEEYMRRMGLGDGSYVIGEAPAENEDLMYMDYDIVFKEIEYFFGEDRWVDKGLYEELHELAGVNDIDVFAGDFDIMVKQGKVSVEDADEFKEDILAFQHDILEGIQMIIDDLEFIK